MLMLKSSRDSLHSFLKVFFIYHHILDIPKGFIKDFSRLRLSTLCYVELCNRPKCSVNPITVTPIWKREFAKGEHPIRGLYRFFLKNLFSNFLFHIKDSKWGKKCIFSNYASCNESPQQIPFQFANG